MTVALVNSHSLGSVESEKRVNFLLGYNMHEYMHTQRVVCKYIILLTQEKLRCSESKQIKELSRLNTLENCTIMFGN